MAGGATTGVSPSPQIGPLKYVSTVLHVASADPQDNYLDAYVSVLRTIDPLTTSLVFNCGMGVVRST